MKKPLWLIPVAGAVLVLVGMSLAAPQAAGVTLIIVGGLGTFVGLGVWSDSMN